MYQRLHSLIWHGYPQITSLAQGKSWSVESSQAKNHQSTTIPKSVSTPAFKSGGMSFLSNNFYLDERAICLSFLIISNCVLCDGS